MFDISLRNLALTIGCVVAFAAASGLVHAAETLENLLLKMQNAALEYDYRGTYVYSHMDNKEVVSIVHAVDEAGFKERLVSMNGISQEIVRTGSGIWCYFPDTKQGYYKADTSSVFRSSAIDPSQISQFQKNYRIEMRESRRMIGRQADRVTFHPKDQYRYGLDLWIDRATGLVLRSDRLDHDAKMVDSYMFVELQLGDGEPLWDTDWTNSGIDFIWNFDQQSVLRAEASDFPWEIGMVPDGYRKIEHSRTPADGAGADREHLVFSDGLSSVSIFFRMAAAGYREEVLDGMSRLGAVHAYSRVIGPHNITVIGEVPDSTVRSIGDSIVWKQRPFHTGH